MQRIENDCTENIEKYAKFGLVGTSWLGFRDIPELINKYIETHGRVLDYGCGAGRSTRFLKSLGLNVMGVDISINALTQAKELDSSIPYVLMENSRIPVVDEFYDFIFSSYVLLVLDSKESILSLLQELYRKLKKDGKIIIVTGSEALHSRQYQWLSYDVDFPENEFLVSGNLCKIKNKNVDAVFYDYHWTERDYKDLFDQAGLRLLHTHKPLGRFHEGYEWKSESEISPHIIYVLKK